MRRVLGCQFKPELYSIEDGKHLPQLFVSLSWLLFVLHFSCGSSGQAKHSVVILTHPLMSLDHEKPWPCQRRDISLPDL